MTIISCDINQNICSANLISVHGRNYLQRGISIIFRKNVIAVIGVQESGRDRISPRFSANIGCWFCVICLSDAAPTNDRQIESIKINKIITNCKPLSSPRPYAKYINKVIATRGRVYPCSNESCIEISNSSLDEGMIPFLTCSITISLLGGEVIKTRNVQERQEYLTRNRNESFKCNTI